MSARRARADARSLAWRSVLRTTPAEATNCPVRRPASVRTASRGTRKANVFLRNSASATHQVATALSLSAMSSTWTSATSGE